MKKAYPTYKETDLPWLKEVPNGWDVERAKYVFDYIDERSESGEETLLSVSEHHGVIPRAQAKVTMFKAESYVGYKLCSPGDLVINSLWAWSRGLGFSEHRGIISTAYDVFRLKSPEKFDYRYFNYLLRTNQYVGEYICRSKGIWISRLQLGTGAFREIPILLPSPEEQRQIAAYLDHKCALIDTFIAKKKRLIELLQEQKQAIINQAVTRGIDSDVALKPSGVDWLGDIPAHWEVKKLKYFSEIKGRIGFRGYTTDDLVPKGQGALTLGATHITSDGKVNLETPVFISWEKYYESPEIMVQTGDLLIVQRGSTCGKVGLIENDIGPTTINPSLVLIKNIKSSSGYLLYYLQGALNDILNLVSSTAIPMLSQTQIGNIIIALPPHSEQYSILSHIRKETGIVDETIERIKAEITLIQEYKTTLIAEAVTGKIDVRDWQPEENADIPENLKTVMS